MKKILEKIKQDMNGYHDIVSDLRDEWFDLCGILSSEDKREDSIIRGIKSSTDSFEEDIFKSVAMIEKIQKKNVYVLTDEEKMFIAERELPSEEFWADGEHTLAEALKSLVYKAEQGHISRITFDYYMEQWGK